jgi:hypothetical protein
MRYSAKAKASNGIYASAQQSAALVVEHNNWVLFGNMLSGNLLFSVPLYLRGGFVLSKFPDLRSSA